MVEHKKHNFLMVYIHYIFSESNSLLILLKQLISMVVLELHGTLIFPLCAGFEFLSLAVIQCRVPLVLLC